MNFTKVLLLSIFLISLASAVDITACTNLAASTTYRLTASISGATGPCINVTNSGAILNLNGNTIDGVGNANTWGINVSGVTSFIVENGTIKEFDKLINVENSSGVKINNVTMLNATGTAPNGRCVRLATNANGDNLININLTNSSCTNSTEEAFFVGRSAGSSNNIVNILVQNNIFRNSTGANGCVRSVDGNVTFNNNTLTQCIVGFDFNNPGFRNITNNLISNITGAGGIRLRASAGGNFIITNNFVYNSSVYLNNSLGITITFTKMALGYNSSHGISNWSSMTLLSQAPTEGTNVFMQPDWISVNDTALSGMNTTANITLVDGSNCANKTIFMKTGFPSTKSNIYTGTTLAGLATCSAGTSNFTVTSFSGYTLGSSLVASITLNNANETENRTFIINYTSSTGNILAYNLTAYYNNTLKINSSVTGISQASIQETTSVISPLVGSDPTNIPWNASIQALISPNIESSTATGNQAVSVWYNINRYNFTTNDPNTIEDDSQSTIVMPAKPGNATLAPTYAFHYDLDRCDDIWANNSAFFTNTTPCDDSLMSLTNISLFDRLPSHRQEQALLSSSNRSLVQTRYFLSRYYNLTFNQSGAAESNSAKSLSAINASQSNDTYVWLCDITDCNPFNITFAAPGFLINSSMLDEINASRLDTDSYSSALQVRFNDGSNKTYNINYTNRQNFTVKAYPANGTFKIFRYEEFTESGYTTRRRIYADFFDFNTTYSHNVYLLSFGNPGATAVQIIVSGFPTANFVRVFKEVSGERQLDDRYLDTNFQTFGTFIQDAFYTIRVYDAEGNLLHSQTNMQVDCTISCRLTVSGTTLNVTIFNPFNYLINCQNNVTYGGANDSLRNRTPSSGFVFCDVLENPGNYTFTLRNIVNQTIICSNTTIQDNMACAFNITQTNVWQVTTVVGGTTYVVASGSFNPPFGITFGLDGAIIWILATVAILFFIWHNMIVAGFLMSAFSITGSNLSIIPQELAIIGILGGLFIAGIGIFKRK